MSNVAPTAADLKFQNIVAAAAIGVLTLALGTCGTVKYRQATEVALDVALTELSNPDRVPSGTLVRVQAEVLPKTKIVTFKKHAMIALAGSDVAVWCDDDDNAACFRGGEAKRELIGRVEGVWTRETGVFDTFIKHNHLDPARARFLDVGDLHGARREAIIAFSIGGFLLLAVIGLLLRAFVFPLPPRPRTTV